MNTIETFKIQEGHWASSGNRDNYKWFASTNFYHNSLFKINDYEKECNNQVENNCNHIGSYWKILKKQLDNDILFQNHSDICVINTEEIYHSNTQLGMNDNLNKYFNYNYSILKVTDNGINVSCNLLNNKTIIFPFVYLEEASLNFIDSISSYIIKNSNVKSIIAIFACRIASNSDDTFPNQNDFPYISDNSFAQEISFEMFQSLKNLYGNTSPQETFHRKQKPISLKGTTWISSNGKHKIQFDEHSVNGAYYNGEFVIYQYSTTNQILSLTTIEGLAQSYTYNVKSISSDTMVLYENKLGEITLHKQN